MMFNISKYSILQLLKKKINIIKPYFASTTN